MKTIPLVRTRNGTLHIAVDPGSALLGVHLSFPRGADRRAVVGQLFLGPLQLVLLLWI